MVYKLSLNVSSLDEYPKDMSHYQIGVDIHYILHRDT